MVINVPFFYFIVDKYKVNFSFYVWIKRKQKKEK